MKMKKKTTIFLIFFLIKKCLAQELTTTTTPSSGPLICNPPSFRLFMPKEVVYDHFEKIHVLNQKETECSRNPMYTWTVYILNTDLKPNQITYVKLENVLDFEGPSPKSENNILLSKADPSIPLYRYEFQMSVKLIPAAGWNPWHQNKTFLAEPYKMSVSIKGGINRVHTYGSGNLILDASDSRDESYRDGGIESMKANKITWKCSPEIQHAESQSLLWNISDEAIKDVSKLSCSITIVRVGTPFYPQKRMDRQTIKIEKPPTPLIELTCTANCDPSDSFKNTTLRMICRENCVSKSKPKWTFSPHNQTIVENYLIYQPDDYITFLSRAFRPGDEVRIVATLEDASEELTITYRIPQPKLSLLCLENCAYEPRAKTVVELECESDCENMEIKWEISRNDLDLKEWQSENKMSLKIKPNVFKDADNLIITTTSYSSVATLDITFQELIPELTLTCQVSDAENSDCGETAPDPRETIILTVKCEKNCAHLNISWAFDPKVLDFDQPFEVDDSSQQTEDALQIEANSFTDQQNMKVTVTSGKTLITFNTTFIVKTPELAIECLSNCEEMSSTQEETRLKPVCVANCKFLDFVWSVNSVSPSKVKTWMADKNVLIIPPGNLVDGDNTFGLTSGKGSTTLVKQFVEPVAELEIVCEANCETPNPGKETVLKVNCLSPPNICSVQYQWAIAPLPQNFSWKEKTSQNEQQTILTLKPNAFSDNDSIEFKVSDGRKAETSRVLEYVKPEPVLEIVCEQNCDPSHPGYLTELKVQCRENCEPNYEWDFAPKPGNLIKAIDVSGEIVTIASDAYEDGNSVEVSVKSGRGSTSYHLQYKKQPPVLQLFCTPPCDSLHDPNELIIVNATCITYCPKSSNFTWSVEPQDPSKEYDHQKVIIQKNNDSFIILPDTFADGMNVTVTVFSVPENQVPMILSFVETPPDILLECVENCWEANPLDNTVLKASCRDFCKNVNTYQWFLAPEPDNWQANITLGPKNTTIVIKPETYKDLDTVNVTLFARNANKTQQLKFIELPATLTLTCVSNCNPSNPYEDVILEANCTKYCYEIHYLWDQIEPIPENWELNSKTHLNKKNTTMVILKNFFKDGDAHRFYVTSRKGSAHIDVHFVVPAAVLELTCLTNCSPADPLEDIEIQAMCLKYCYENYQWSLIPLAASVTFNETTGPNNTLIIAAEKYLDQGSVRVKIFTNNSETFFDIYFTEPTPLLKLTCETCINSVLNPFEDAKFNVTCLERCKHLNYTWDFSPTSSNIVYGEANATATIPKATFEDKQRVLVTVHSRKGKNEMEIRYQTPPGYIWINCTNHNCPYSNPLKPVVLAIVCVYDCDKQDWKWDIEPVDRNFNWTQQIKTDETNVTLTILPEAFADGQVVQVHAWADGSDSIRNTTVIQFEEHVPNITLTCKTNCAPFNALRDVELEAKCWENCEQLKYKWTLVPESFHVTLANNSDSVFTIKGGSYYFNETVVVFLQARKANANLTITFGPAGWDGECDFEPKTGISGVTEFAIGCDYFQDGVTYRVYQDYPGLTDELGVLLTYGKNKFSDYVYLSAGQTVLTIAVGNDFETKKTIRLKIGTVRSLPDAKSAKLFQKILGEKIEELKGMVESQSNYHKTVQFASLLWTALTENAPEDLLHYAKHIIAEMNSLSDIIEPTQLLSLYTKFVSNSNSDILSACFLVEGIRGSVQNMITRKSETIYSNQQVVSTFCNKTLSLLSTLMLGTQLLNQTVRKPLPGFDYPIPVVFISPHADFQRHLRQFTQNLLATTEILPKLMKDESLTSKLIKLNVGELSASDGAKLAVLKIPGTKSYVTTSPKFRHSVQATGKTFQYVSGYFSMNPFWWQNLGINTDHIQFSADSLPGPIIVHLSLKSSATASSLKATVTHQIIFELSVKPDAMFSATFTKTNFTYTVKTYPKIQTAVVNKTMTINYQIDQEQFIYVVISSEQPAEFVMDYKLLECFSWTAFSLFPTKTGCRVVENDPKFLSCECSHLSHFGGKLSVPEISQQTKETMEFGNVSVNVFISILVGISFFIFVILVAVGFFRDNKEKESRVIFLDDNQPGGTELYFINVASGLCLGTTSDVAIELTGTESKSRIHLLQGEKTKPLASRNNEHFFAMYAEKNLGDLLSIRLWANSKGKYPEWYCERVIIEHVATRQCYLFLIEKWFALLTGDCLKTGTFPAIARKPRIKFWQRLRETIRENNHLMTLFTQRPRGTNKETIVTGYAACSAVMLAAYFLTIYASDFPLIATAVLSAAISLPFTFLLTHLFRNSA